MIFQVGQLGEAFQTDVTAVRFFAGVNKFVTVKFGRRGELLAAVDALVATVVDCAGSHDGRGALRHLNERAGPVCTTR